jgi:zinc protease
VSAPEQSGQMARQSRQMTPPSLGPERPVAWPKRREHKLANGLLVVLAEIMTFPRISAELFFRSGNAAVALTSPGLAEMTATVVRTGTGKHTSREIEEKLRSMGAGLGTSAGADTSAISIAGLSEFSEGMLDLMADLACNASFPAEEFERERRQRIEDLRISRATPGFLTSERLRRVLFGAHPYAIVAPTELQVQSYRREQLREFYARHYVPSDAVLVVVGDFRTDDMLGKIERIFGGWCAPEPPAENWSAPPRHEGRGVHLVHVPGAVQADVAVGNLSIVRQHPDWQRLVLANAIYGGAFNSRLIANIREQKGYTYSPRSTSHALRECGYFTVRAAVRNEVVAATLTEIFYEMDRMRSLEVSEGELDDARNYVSGSFSLGVATQDGILSQISGLYLDGLAADYLETYRDRMRSLTRADVMTAARKYFDSPNAQIVVAGDRSAVEEQLALFGRPQVWDAHGHKL